METGEALTGLTGLLSGALAIFWWQRRDLAADNAAHRWRVPLAIFLTVVSLANLAAFILGLTR